MQPKPITFKQSFREADAFAVWPELAKIVDPLTRGLKATKRGREAARRSLVDAEGRPPVNNKLRAKLRQIPAQDLARVVVHAVLAAMIGWLKEDEDGELEENPFNAAVLQDVARSIGRHVLQAYMRLDRPNLTPQRADRDLEADWTLGQQTAIGFLLLNALQHAVPQLLNLEERRQDTFLVRLQPGAITRYGLDTLIRAAAHRPMVEPPKPWAQGERGGYRYALEGSVPLVRAVPADASDPDCPDAIVYHAVNTLQATAWRVNPGVLAAAQRDATLTKQERLILLEAELEADEEALYFVHSLDFRGRVYPVATYLSPQGPELARALLMFAEGCRITAQDTAALAALENYGAQSTGWQRLAFTLEREALRKALDAGQTYESHLPIWQDASANGLQHMAFLCGDKALAQAVGLLGGKSVIYAQIGQAMTRRLQRARDRAAKGVLRRCGREIDRDRAKPPTMVFGYGAKKHGIAARFAKDQRGGKKLTKPQRKQLWKHAQRFADVAWEALQAGPTKRAFKFREWVKQVGRSIAKNGLEPAKWDVPGTQFPAKQWHSFAVVEGQMTFWWGPTKHRPTVLKNRLSTLTKGQHATSLPPNLIHSLDAAHLMLTVQVMRQFNVPMATVHDGFATWATHAPQLAQMFHMGFITLYHRGSTILDDLTAQFRRQCPTIRAFKHTRLPKQVLDGQPLHYA